MWVDLEVAVDIGSAGMLSGKDWSQQSLPFALQHQFPRSTPGQGSTKYPAFEATDGN